MSGTEVPRYRKSHNRTLIWIPIPQLSVMIQKIYPSPGQETYLPPGKKLTYPRSRNLPTLGKKLTYPGQIILQTKARNLTQYERDTKVIRKRIRKREYAFQRRTHDDFLWSGNSPSLIEKQEHQQGIKNRPAENGPILYNNL